MSIMAKLFRVVKLQDRFNTEVFTFQLPAKLMKDSAQTSFSKDFNYGYQKWTASFVKSEKHLGAFLRLRTASPHVVCNVDYAFTMVNTEHFTKNETFIEKGSEFTKENDTRGRQTFISLEDLVSRTFIQQTGEFLVELELRHMTTAMECFVRVPKDYQARYASNIKLETPYFSFGLFDWSISLYPNTPTQDSEGNVAVQLHRHTNFDHLCRVQYDIKIGENQAFESGTIEQWLDGGGNGEPYIIGSTIHVLSRGRSTVRVRVNMYSVVSIGEAVLPVLNKNRNRVHLYDKDKQAWMLESDISGKYLAFKLYYTDVSHVPRKCTRLVSFDLAVLSIDLERPTIKASNGPFSRYYVQEDLDEGFKMHTNIPLQNPRCEFLSADDQKVTVHIHWIDSHLLTTPTYHSLDDVSRLHKHQMMREILALQSENYALEKQLYSYQKSIARTHSRGQSESEDYPPDRNHYHR
ncbi:uncharacterized protein [Magallana gigas]|uniref:uncharacterized protein isoform X3 n=1 Tax=Magallana gigas TaxID=29159 RepID=UPI00334125AB